LFFRGRKKVSVLTRATLGSLMIAVAALWALTVSYDITWRELLGYLLGSLFVLVAAMASAIAVVVLFKLLRRGGRWLIDRLSDR